MRSGSSMCVDRDVDRRRAPQRLSRDRESDVRRARPDAHRLSERRTGVGDPHAKRCRRHPCDGLGRQMRAARHPVEEDRDDRVAGEVHATERCAIIGREPARPSALLRARDGDVADSGLAAAGLRRTAEQGRPPYAGRGSRRSDRRESSGEYSNESDQVPSSQDARYFSCSAVSVSISTPIVASLSFAISSSISVGTG